MVKGDGQAIQWQREMALEALDPEEVCYDPAENML